MSGLKMLSGLKIAWMSLSLLLSYTDATMQSRAKGITGHVLPLGVLFFLFFFFLIRST